MSKIDFTKLFTFVNAADHDVFVTKYITPAEGATRLTDYDNKICFLESSQEIFTHGKIYGINNTADVANLVLVVNALDEYVGDIPEGASSKTIVDYIVEKCTEVYNSILPIKTSQIDKLFE
jgi:hypothetical protein